jgi:hypothetical protein
MKNKLFLAVLAMVVLAIGLMVAGCASISTEASVPKAITVEEPPITPKLDELLHKYMAPQVSIYEWGGVEGLQYSYYLEPLHFEDFKANLDAGEEFLYSGTWTDDNRITARGMAFARWREKPVDQFQLDFCDEDKPLIRYHYKIVTPAQREKLDNSLRKYMGPEPQRWGDDEKPTLVYFLDPLRFEAFKTELDAEGNYKQVDSWTGMRDWDKGTAFARFAVRPDGSFELELGKEDNSRIGYRYQKIH